MIALFAIALVAAFIGLVLASRLAPPAWLWALRGMAFSLAVAALAGTGIAVERLGLAARWKPLVLPGAAAVMAVGCHRWLLAWLSPSDPVPRIDFWRLQLAALAIAGGLFALLGGVAVLSRAATSWTHLATAGIVVAAALFALGPLLVRVGVPLDYRTFLGLTGLGLGAYAVIEGAKRAGAR